MANDATDFSDPELLEAARDEALRPYVEEEVRAERARLLAYDRETLRHSGVRLSGFEPDRPAPRTARDLIAAAMAAKARTDTYRDSPEGQLAAALYRIDVQVGAVQYTHGMALDAKGRGLDAKVNRDAVCLRLNEIAAAAERLKAAALAGISDVALIGLRSERAAA